MDAMWKNVEEIAAHNAEQGRSGMPDAFEPLTTLTLQVEGIAVDGTDVVLVHFGKLARIAQDDVVGWRERTGNEAARGYDVRIKKGARVLVQQALIADSHEALAPLYDTKTERAPKRDEGMREGSNGADERPRDEGRPSEPPRERERGQRERGRSEQGGERGQREGGRNEQGGERGQREGGRNEQGGRGRY